MSIIKARTEPYGGRAPPGTEPIKWDSKEKRRRRKVRRREMERERRSEY
jgi:hypothetical protein